MVSRFLILSLFSLQFITACGGGGGEGSDSSAEVMSADGVLLKDMDSMPKDGVVGQLAVGSNEVENSVCFAELPDFREINDLYYNKSITDPSEDFYFNYFIGEDETTSSEYQLAFLGQNREVYDILSALLFNVKLRSATGQDPIYSISNTKEIYHDIRSYCRDIQCAADSIFGDSWGLRFLMKDRFGVVLSGHVDTVSEEYESDEYLQSVAQAVLSLPKGTFPLKRDNFLPGQQEFSPTNVVIAPYLTGQSPGAGTEGAAGVTLSSRGGYSREESMLTNIDVFLLDPWKQSRDFYGRLYTVFHELIHVLDQAQESKVVLSASPEWIRISDWRFNKGNNTWYMGKEDLRCSDYGSTSPAEDFAECGSVYRFAPNRLKKISKAKYNFFKNRVFSGIEYNDIKRCGKAVETF